MTSLEIWNYSYGDLTELSRYQSLVEREILWEGLGSDRPTSGQAVVWVARSSHRWPSPLGSPGPPPAPARGVDQ